MHSHNSRHLIITAQPCLLVTDEVITRHAYPNTSRRVGRGPLLCGGVGLTLKTTVKIKVKIVCMCAVRIQLAVK
jgi:hypothetical protein